MEEKRILIEFLAWVQDNFLEQCDDKFYNIDDESSYNREQMVEMYLELYGNKT